ncbi:cytochrome P450 family protein [Nocardia asiatica]|uniref:hypothetical protein n=1 Tax=Nocardia asiatica TaxID=209252 RepID=UPI00245560F3|nr:hypothetical protein [Nocardia asiatica]
MNIHQSVEPQEPMSMTPYRPSTPLLAGAERAKYWSAAAAIRQIDLDEIHSTVDRTAPPLVSTFCGNGHAELTSQYALPLVSGVINSVLGVPPDLSERATGGMAAILDGTEEVSGDTLVGDIFLELVRRKREQPGDDVTTRLINGSIGPTDEELVHQLRLYCGAGIQPAQYVLINTLRFMLTDDRFAERPHWDSLSQLNALHEALFTDPQPHLGPAWDVAYVVAREAIYQLLNALPDMKLAVPSGELIPDPGAFHRTLPTLPVIFPPSHDENPSR